MAANMGLIAKKCSLMPLVSQIGFHVQKLYTSFTRNQNKIPLASIDQENEAMEKAKLSKKDLNL
jgi:hypothetical protein